jgi:hypothetical protein
MARTKPSAGDPSLFNIHEDRPTLDEYQATIEKARLRQVEDLESSQDDSESGNDFPGSSNKVKRPRVIDPAVAEDMAKFEESFKGITRRYRLIDRIGEGEIEPRE